MGFLDKILGPPSRDKFAQWFIAALKSAGDEREVRFDADEFRLTFSRDEEEQGVLNLTNLYIEFCNVNKSDRKQCLKEMVKAALSHLKEMPEDFSDASYDIRPRLWTRSTFEQLRLRQQIESGERLDWPLEQIGEHLYLSLVYDLPESVRSISNEDLENWGVSFWESREIAVGNLADTKFVYASVGDELYASNTGDSYDATRLVLTELIDEFQIEGRPIAMVPNRDTLLVTGSESEIGQKMMLEFALQQLRDQPRPMIATPLVLTEDREWVDWKPTPDNVLFEEYRRLEMGWMQIEYSEQKQLLEVLFEKQLIEDFVASYNVIEDEDGSLCSYCVWSDGIKSILPKTDYIFFLFEPNEELKKVRWESLESVVGDMLESMEYYPPRFRVIGYPSNNDFEQMNLEIVEKK